MNARRTFLGSIAAVVAGLFGRRSVASQQPLVMVPCMDSETLLARKSELEPGESYHLCVLKLREHGAMVIGYYYPQESLQFPEFPSTPENQANQSRLCRLALERLLLSRQAT